MDVAVLGAGNGGCAVAYDWARAGHSVRLFSAEDYPGESPAVAERGEIVCTGQEAGVAPISYAGSDPERAVSGAELIFVVGPAYATEALASAVGPHLAPGQDVVVCPTSCLGSLAFRRAAGLAPDDDRFTVGETSTLPYAVRITAPATINIFLKLGAGIWCAASPRADTERLTAVLAEVYPGMRAAGSVLATTLQNGNPVIHPAVTISNAARIDGGTVFDFYEDGVTPAVGRLMRAVDDERQAIAAAYGQTILSDPAMGVIQGYMVEENYDTGYSTAPGFKGIKAQRSLEDRYLTEDVGYTLVLFTELGRLAGVPTPTMDALIRVASVLLDRDLAAPGTSDSGAPRTLAHLGLAGLSATELAAL
jgi:opine dehydrogenase